MFGDVYFLAVILSPNKTYDENLNVDKLKDEWKHHSPYFWLERMTFLAAFGFDIPEAGLKITVSRINQCNPNIVDISGAISTLSLSKRILHFHREEGAWDVNNILVAVVKVKLNVKRYFSTIYKYYQEMRMEYEKSLVPFNRTISSSTKVNDIRWLFVCLILKLML